MDHTDRLYERLERLEDDVLMLKLQLFATKAALLLAGLLWIFRSVVA